MTNDKRTWKEHLGAYDFPTEIEDGLRGRRRRRARRRYRHAHLQETKEYIAERRRQEPVTAAGAVILLTVMLGIGLIGHWLLDSGTGHGRHPVTVTVSPPPLPDRMPTTASPAPSATQHVDLSNPSVVAQQFARHYLTRNPPVDGSHAASVGRAAAWMTPALAANLAGSPDPDFDKLVSRGGISKVTRVKVTTAGSDLPGDTPLRIWRTVTATVSVHGYTSYTQTRTLQTELIRTAQGWLVSRILGV